ncbi:MAG: hypothetical protein IH986_09155 [Planctomycetes bacterium]|nr:hypothetical protein [Planctomycetota bacterium]
MLRERFTGFELGPVQMIQNPKLKRSSRVTKRTKPRVWLPYEGPELHELWVTRDVPMDGERTTAHLVKRCASCGCERYELDGAENIEGHWDRERRTYLRMRKPREQGKGVFLRKRDLGDADIFYLREFCGWVFCTDRVKRFIEERGYTNIDFFEMGEVV